MCKLQCASKNGIAVEMHTVHLLNVYITSTDDVIGVKATRHSKMPSL